MRRYDIERAVLAAELPGPSVAIMLTLCTRIWADEGIIPPDRQPSLTQLAADTGYDRSTVIRHLGPLEQEGWVIRIRPPKWLAQQLHVTTAYAMQIPPGYAQARGARHPGLAALRGEARRLAEEALAARDAEARRAAAHELAAGSGKPGGGAPRNAEDQNPDGAGRRSSSGDDAASTQEQLVAIAHAELAVMSGRPVSEATAAEATRLVLGGRGDVKRPAAYLRSAIRKDPARFLPRAGLPPRVSDLDKDGRALR